MVNLGVLASGSGSNLQAIIDNIEAGRLDAQIKIVISNIPDVYALERARKHGIPSMFIPHKGFKREEYDQKMVEALKANKVELVILAGFMRIITHVLLRAFPMKVVNIHPALLPAFPGTHVWQMEVDSGVKFAGCTVHFVDEELDHGAIIVQKTVPVLDADDEHSLAARILEQEHVAYTEAVKIVLERKYDVVGRRLVRGQR